MISITGNAKIFCHRNAIDLRKGFEGLSGIVEGTFKQKVTDGSFFVFINNRRDRMKILYWDNDGLSIWYKRLEMGRFPKRKIDNELMDRREFFMLLEGITPSRLQKRYKAN